MTDDQKDADVSPYEKFMAAAEKLDSKGFAAARAEAEKQIALALDAERYRWLRNDSLQVLVAGPIVCMADKWGALHKDSKGGPVLLDLAELDAAIDAAMVAAAERDGRSKC